MRISWREGLSCGVVEHEPREHHPARDSCTKRRNTTLSPQQPNTVQASAGMEEGLGTKDVDRHDLT